MKQQTLAMAADRGFEQFRRRTKRDVFLNMMATRYAYSNYGVALLGQALSHRAGCDFDELLEERVIVPLQMHRTSMAPIAAFESSTAVGYNALFEKVPPWYMGASGGAGGLRSTVVDQLRFLEANLNPDDSTLGRALRAVRIPRRPNGQADGQVALGWQVLKDHGEVFWHAGATAGFLSFVGVYVERETGAVVLSNTLSIMDIRHWSSLAQDVAASWDASEEANFAGSHPVRVGRCRGTVRPHA